MKPRVVRLSCWIYAVMLRAYPSSFRREYSREMMLVFEDRAGDVLEHRGSWALMLFAHHVLWDWLLTIVRERNDMETNTSRFGLGAVGIAAIPSIAFTLHDFVFQMSDNQHESTLGFFITVGGLISVWGLCGYFAARRVQGAAAAMKSGAVAGIISVAILWLSFAVLNNVFVGRMSYEPDRLRAFHNSRYSSMRAYVNFGLVLSSFFPVLMSAAALVAAAGGAMRNVTKRWRV